MDPIDEIFFPYRGQTIEMDFQPGSTFSEIISELEKVLGSDNTIGFMMGPVLKYTEKYGIKDINNSLNFGTSVNKGRLGLFNYFIFAKYLGGSG
jgi:hypothetical protein